jgi:O-antigen/teichoic acid export membrane protein
MSLVSAVLPRNRFARGVSVLISGTVGAQAVMMLAAPILTRLYSPADFGLLAVFVALLSAVSVVASLRYELAIPLPVDESEAAALLVLSLMTTVAVSGISTIPILVYRDALAQLLNTPALADHLYLVPLGALLIGVYNVLNYWAVRMRAFTPIAKTKVGQSIACAAIQVGGAPFGPVALLLGQVTGHAAGSLSLGLRVLRHRWIAVRRVTRADLVQVACRYKKFPLFSTWSALFNTAGGQMPPILFAALFNPAVAGIYALANRVLAMPMQLLGQAIGTVFLSGAAQARREGRLGLTIARIHNRLAHIGMPPMLVLLLAGPEIFKHVFGAEWRQAGVFAQWLAPWLYLGFITSPLSSLFDVLDKQEIEMAFDAALLIARTAAIIVGGWFGDVMIAVGLLAIGSCACRLATLIWLLRACGNPWREIWRPSFDAVVWAAVLVSPVVVIAVWDGGRAFWPIVVAAVIASGLIAARYVYLMKQAWL